MSARPAAGGGRWVEVDPARLPRWLDGFVTRHGVPVVTVEPYGLRLHAPDDTVAEWHRPPGVRSGDQIRPGAGGSGAGGPGAGGAGADGAGADGPGAGGPGADGAVATGGPADPDRFAAEAGASRPLALLLVRRGGYAVGIADGPELSSSKVDTSYVQSRTAAGGWSQHRFARRRDNQARALVGSAADTAVRVLLPGAGRVVALVCGGDRHLVDQVLDDRRLASLRELRAERFLDVPDPRLAVLRDAVARARAVRIRIEDPPSAG